MTKYLRYALVTCCFAISVGCLALWYRSDSGIDSYLQIETKLIPDRGLWARTHDGTLMVGFRPETNIPTAVVTLSYLDITQLQNNTENPVYAIDAGKRFGRASLYTKGTPPIAFPLWYPALVFALAGVGILRLGRFTIRSAIIATTIVALLLGMAVIL